MSDDLVADPGDGTPSPIEGIDWSVMDRYFAGQTSPAEAAAVERWVLADPARRQLIDDVRAGLNPARDAAAPDPAAGLARTMARIAAADTLDQRARAAGLTPAATAANRGNVRRADIWRGIAGRGGKGQGYRHWATAAAAAVVVLAAVFVSQRFLTPDPRFPISTHRDYTTAPGQRLSVTLGDGTQFVLAPGTTLHVARDYGRQLREVTVEGEAYFVVAHDALRPFTVHARGATATDVGTRFDVRAYADEPGVRVAVTEGAVDVGAIGRQRASLRSGDVAAVQGVDLSVTHDDNVAALTAWTQGWLVFRHARLDTALAQVARWYGLDAVRMDATVGARRVSGVFTNESLTAVLDTLSQAADARWVRAGRAIAVSRRNDK